MPRSIEADAPLFASLSEAALGLIRDTVEKRHYVRGEVMLHEGDTKAELFVLLSGEAQVEGKDWHGDPLTLAHLGPGQCFGELSMLSGEPASATVKATTDADVWILPHAAFVAIADDHPELARNLSTLLGERLRLSNERQLRSQRGRLIALHSTEAAPWAFVLSFRIASAVAKYDHRPATFLDLSNCSSTLLPANVQASSLNGVADGAGHPTANVNANADEFLSVITGGDTEVRTDQLSDALERLRDTSRHVIAFVPGTSPAAGAVLAQADAVLALALEGDATSRSRVLETDSVQGLILLSERTTVPTIADIKRTQAAVSVPIRAIIPGGRAAADGELPDTSESEGTIGRLARSIIGKTVGLALGGGGAKGYAHIGVLKGLQRAGVPIDCVAGCSIGAPIAAGLAAGWDLDSIRKTIDSVSKKAVRPNVPLISLLSSRGIRAELRSITEDARFDDLPIPLGIVSVDIETGEEVLIRRGLVWRAMVASMAFPGIYEPVRIGSRYLVDGGLLNPVPVSGAVSLGADVVISSNLSGSISDRLANVGSGGPPRQRFIIENISRTLEIMQSKIVDESCTRADVAIEPSFSPAPGLLDFKRGRLLEEVGEQAVEQELPKLRSVLSWLS